MSTYIRIRASTKPGDFFDEVIGDEGFELNGWRLTRHQLPDFIRIPGKPDEKTISRWLHAEADCEPGEWEATLRAKRPALDQALNVLAAVRQTRMAEALEFTMWYEEYVHDGCAGMIKPFRIPICVGIQNVQQINEDGKVIFDARVAQEQYARGQAIKARIAAKSDVQQLTKYIKFLKNPFFCRAWESYQLARGTGTHAMSHMYDLRDAANKGVGGAQKTLGFSNNEWSRFGLILNNQAVEGGRHNGLKTDPIRPLTAQERGFLLKFGEKLLFAFGDYLEAQEKAEKHKIETEKANQVKFAETNEQSQLNQNATPQA